MTASAPPAVSGGRIVALLGIVLVAANLRTAVSTMSPIFDRISVDVPLNAVLIGMLGMVPPLMFSLSGVLSPRLARISGLEWALTIACAAMIAGPLLRAMASNVLMLGVGTVVALLGAGVGNILIPSAVKKYFPNRIGRVTAAYATIMALGSALSPLAAAPAAAQVGWRGWLLSWAFVGVFCAAPWILLALRQRRQARSGDGFSPVRELLPAPIWRSRSAWMIAIAHLAPTVCAYAMFAWLPIMMQDLTGVNAAEAGAMLALFAIMGLPAALFAPNLGVRGWTSQVLLGGVIVFVIGFVGLLTAPAAAPWLWAGILGLGTFSFPLVLALFSLRTRSHQNAASLSGFVQTIGYAGGALGPLLVGALHEMTAGWTWPIVALLLVSLFSLIPTVALRKPVMLEDELTAVARKFARPQ